MWHLPEALGALTCRISKLVYDYGPRHGSAQSLLIWPSCCRRHVPSSTTSIYPCRKMLVMCKVQHRGRPDPQAHSTSASYKLHARADPTMRNYMATKTSQPVPGARVQVGRFPRFYYTNSYKFGDRVDAAAGPLFVHQIKVYALPSSEQAAHGW